MLTIEQALKLDLSTELKNKLKEHPINFIIALTDDNQLFAFDPEQNKHIIFDSDHAEASDEKAMPGAGSDTRMLPSI